MILSRVSPLPTLLLRVAHSSSIRRHAVKVRMRAAAIVEMGMPTDLGACVGELSWAFRQTFAGKGRRGTQHERASLMTALGPRRRWVASLVPLRRGGWLFS